MDYSRLTGRITVHVQSSKPKSKIKEYDNGSQVLYIDIGAPAINGKANLELVRFFKKKLNKQARIISGLSSKRKVIELS